MNTERKILDSGNRREFESGAVRDSADGRGRCDLLPLDIIGEYLFNSLVDDSQGCVYDKILIMINEFIRTGDTTNIYSVIEHFVALNKWSPSQALLELSKHYEEGAKKYAERNWEKGIPAHCYIDSGVRHFLKWIDKWDDEPHDRAFLWNMFGLLWTVKHKPECNDLPYVEKLSKQNNDNDNDLVLVEVNNGNKIYRNAKTGEFVDSERLDLLE